MSRDGLVHRDERHLLLRNVVHVSKGEHSLFTLCGFHEKFHVANAGRRDRLAVYDPESFGLRVVDR